MQRGQEPGAGTGRAGSGKGNVPEKERRGGDRSGDRPAGRKAGGRAPGRGQERKRLKERREASGGGRPGDERRK